MSSYAFTTSRTQIISLLESTLATNTKNYGNISTNITDEPLFTSIDGIINNTDLFTNATTVRNHYSDNDTIVDDEELFKKDFAFDRTDVRVIFITMYTLVFCCCFFGKFTQVEMRVCLVFTFHCVQRTVSSIFVWLVWSNRNFLKTVYQNEITMNLSALSIRSSFVCFLFSIPSLSSSFWIDIISAQRK